MEAVSRLIYQTPALNLDQVASQFAMSPATFKRKLKAHGVRFSTLYDEQSKRKAIYLLAMRNNAMSKLPCAYHFMILLISDERLNAGPGLRQVN